MTAQLARRCSDRAERRIAWAALGLLCLWLVWWAIGGREALGLHQGHRLVGLIAISAVLTLLGLIGVPLALWRGVQTQLVLTLLSTPVLHLLSWMAQPGLTYYPTVAWACALIACCWIILSDVQL